jgi:hypothetical protein
MSTSMTIWIYIDGESVQVIIHPYPHLDEIIALLILECHGTTALLNKYCPDSILRLGVEGGPFDEHPDQHSGAGRKKGCCATLVADALDLHNVAPWWDNLLKFCEFRDTGDLSNPKKPSAVERAHPYDLYRLVNSSFRDLMFMANQESRDPTDEEQLAVINDCKVLVHRALSDDASFYRATKDIREKSSQQMIPGPEGKMLKLVVVESNEWTVEKAARFNFSADITVQRNTSGHVHIFTRTSKHINLNDLAQALKIAEQNAEGDIRENDWNLLRGEGVFDDEDKWYRSKKQHGQIHNGTERHNEYKPTLLSLHAIVGLIKLSLDTQLFQYDSCQQGKCLGKHKCSGMYHFGFQRCRAIRYKEMHEAKEQLATS